MMKLKVVNDCRKLAVVEADTIDTLVSRIMECFSLNEEDLSQRLLVPGGRDLVTPRYATPKVGGFDLLQLEEGSFLNDELCKDCVSDGYTLLLGWKGSFIISLYHRYGSRYSNIYINIMVRDPYVTLGELKQMIATQMRKPLTLEIVLPRILLEGDDNKPLIFFGFYKHYKGLRGARREMVTFRINRNRPKKMTKRIVVSKKNERKIERKIERKNFRDLRGPPYKLVYLSQKDRENERKIERKNFRDLGNKRMKRF